MGKAEVEEMGWNGPSHALRGLLDHHKNMSQTARETAQPIKCLQHMHRDLNSDLQHPTKAGNNHHTCNVSTRGKGAGGSPGLAGQPV